MYLSGGVFNSLHIRLDDKIRVEAGMNAKNFFLALLLLNVNAVLRLPH